MGLAQAATLYEPAFAVITANLGAQARQGILYVTLLGGFAGTVFAPLTQWLIEAIEMIGTAAFDTYKLADSNMRQIQRQRRWSAGHFRSLGVEVNDGEPFVGASAEQLDQFGSSFFALGSHLQATYPNDAALAQLFDGVVLSYNALVKSLAGDQSFDEEGDGEGGEQ